MSHHNAGILQEKKGLIIGLANDHSIAWGIAQAVYAQGAQLALTYQNEAFLKRIRPLAQQVETTTLLPCDVLQPQQIRHVFESLKTSWGHLDFLVHAVAFSDRQQLKGRYVDTTRDNFLQTMDISCYSLTDIVRYAAPLMHRGGSILTLTYHGSQRVIPHYNVMGVAKAALEASVRYMAMDLGPHNIRVNSLSAGPVRTLAASGIHGFRTMLEWSENNAPLRRSVTLADIGNAATYLLSHMSSGVTGEVHHVDCGYNVVGMKALETAAV